MADSNEVSVIGLMDCPRVHGCTEAVYLGTPPWTRPLPTYYCSSLCGQWAENLTAMWQGYTEILPSQEFRASGVTHHLLHHCCVTWSVTLYHVSQQYNRQTEGDTSDSWTNIFLLIQKWSSLGHKNYYAMETMSFVICCSPHPWWVKYCRRAQLMQSPTCFVGAQTDSFAAGGLAAAQDATEAAMTHINRLISSPQWIAMSAIGSLHYRGSST